MLVSGRILDLTHTMILISWIIIKSRIKRQMNNLAQSTTSRPNQHRRQIFLSWAPLRSTWPQMILSLSNRTRLTNRWSSLSPQLTNSPTHSSCKVLEPIAWSMRNRSNSNLGMETNLTRFKVVGAFHSKGMASIWWTLSRMPSTISWWASTSAILRRSEPS